jgi:hypothetical protein
MKMEVGVEVLIHLFITSAPDWRQWSGSRLPSGSPLKKPKVPFAQGDGRAPGVVWKLWRYWLHQELSRCYKNILCHASGDIPLTAVRTSCKSKSYLTIDGRSASLSWFQAIIWEPGTKFLSLPCKSLLIVAFIYYGGPSLTRGSVRNFQYSQNSVRTS